MPPRPFVLHEANYRQLIDHRPTVAILPWGATEAHNYHLPHGTDVIEAVAIAERAAGIVHDAGRHVIVLPAIPFGNNAQQLDQVATIHIRTTTALAILADVARSLHRQGIDRLMVLNAHGGNDLKPIIRDVQTETGVLIVLINFYQLLPDLVRDVFDEPGDHAGELETSFILHERPDWVSMNQAGPGAAVPFRLSALQGTPGVWTPRPWSATHPDTGSGNPRLATREKGRQYVEAISAVTARIVQELADAKKGDVPYC